MGIFSKMPANRASMRASGGFPFVPLFRREFLSFSICKTYYVIKKSLCGCTELVVFGVINSRVLCKPWQSQKLYTLDYLGGNVFYFGEEGFKMIY